mmetsp:Transcript_45105/g.84134  ORF Transcript_45105/g.84134 Transcript_45105/m.84134 type:complete len:343 (-) Transcript_45105:725-1753(-)
MERRLQQHPPEPGDCGGAGVCHQPHARLPAAVEHVPARQVGPTRLLPAGGSGEGPPRHHVRGLPRADAVEAAGGQTQGGRAGCCGGHGGQRVPAVRAGPPRDTEGEVRRERAELVLSQRVLPAQGRPAVLRRRRLFPGTRQALLRGARRRQLGACEGRRQRLAAGWGGPARAGLAHVPDAHRLVRQRASVGTQSGREPFPQDEHRVLQGTREAEVPAGGARPAGGGADAEARAAVAGSDRGLQEILRRDREPPGGASDWSGSRGSLVHGYHVHSRVPRGWQAQGAIPQVQHRGRQGQPEDGPAHAQVPFDRRGPVRQLESDSLPPEPARAVLSAALVRGPSA